MDKTIVGVIAAVASLAPMAAAQAAPTPAEVERAMNVRSFAEILESVPNAAAILKADDALRAQEEPAADVKVAWHHHHHHNWWWHHHHHHHHWHHHHHHHHHHWW